MSNINRYHPNNQEENLDSEKRRKSIEEESERVRYAKNPLEFDTQTRQEMFNNDNGALSDRRRVTSDPSSIDKHDYRFLKGAYELTEYNEEPSTKSPKPLTEQVAKSEKGRAMQWAAEERELAFDEGEGQNPEEILLAKEERKQRNRYSVGESWARRNLGKLRFNERVINEVADEADQLNPKDVNEARRLIARLEGLKLPATIDRKLEHDYQDVIDANRGRKEQLKTINSVLVPLYKVVEVVDEEKEAIEGFAKQVIAELKNVKRALKAISEILSTPKDKRMPNWYQVVQGWNRDMLQANTYLLSLFVRARATNPDMIMKAYPLIAHQAPELKRDYLETAPAFAATHNHFEFSEKVMEDAREHKSPLARAMDGVMKRERPEEDDMIAFHTQVTRLPRKKVESLVGATRGTIKSVVKVLGSTIQESKKEKKAVA